MFKSKRFFYGRLFSDFRLAQERETYLRNKRLQQEELKTALDNQVNRQFSSSLFRNLFFIRFEINQMVLLQRKSLHRILVLMI